VPRTASTNASTLDCAGSCSTSILPVLKRTSAFATPGRALSAFSIFGTQEGHESSSLRRMVFWVMIGFLSIVGRGVPCLIDLRVRTRIAIGETGKPSLHEYTGHCLGSESSGDHMGSCGGIAA